MNIEYFKKLLPCGLFGGLSLLGFTRGTYSYNYSCNKSKKQYFYFQKGCWGIFTAFAYLNPCTLIYLLYKELYRVEVNLRGLEYEKKSDYYNEVF